MAFSATNAKNLTDRFKQVWKNFDETRRPDPLHCITLLTLVDVSHQAFKAYIDPETTTTLEEWTPDDNRIEYLNTSYLNNNAEGVLKIHLHCANNIPNKDCGFWNKSDPYIIFTVGTFGARSEIKFDNLNPVWDSTHYLIVRKDYVQTGVHDTLNVTLMDSDAHESPLQLFVSGSTANIDDFLGSGKISLDDIRSGGIHSYDLVVESRCSKKQKGKTTVTLSVQMLSVDEIFEEKELQKGIPPWMKEIEDGVNQESAWPDVDWLRRLGRVPLDPVAFVSVQKTDTQAWVCVNRGTKTIRVSFRGTETNRARDTLMDLQFWKSTPCCLRHNSIYSLNMRQEIKDAKNEIQVHSGFMRAYDSVRESLLQILYDITNWSSEWSICITGHSLGGAIATLCAFEFANRKTENGEGPVILMVSFGAPRVGNLKFAELYNKTVIGSFRVVNHDDPVHVLPPLFVHTAKEVVSFPSGEIVIEKKQFLNQTVSKVLINTREGKHRVTDSSGGFDALLLKYFGRLRSMLHHHETSTYKANLGTAAKVFFGDTLPVKTSAEE